MDSTLRTLIKEKISTHQFIKKARCQKKYIRSNWCSDEIAGLLEKLDSALRRLAPDPLHLPSLCFPIRVLRPVIIVILWLANQASCLGGTTLQSSHDLSKATHRLHPCGSPGWTRVHW